MKGKKLTNMRTQNTDENVVLTPIRKMGIAEQLSLLKKIPISAKFGGATGNFNAHIVAYAKYDWLEFSKKFIARISHIKIFYFLF